MTRALLVTAVLAITSAAIASDGPEVRIAVQGDADVAFGQLVRVFVDVISPQPFYEAPVFPDLEIPGSIALQPEQRGSSFSERRGADVWFGVRKSYAIFPQTAGVMEIPPVIVRLGTDADAVKLTTTSTSLRVRAPAIDIPLTEIVSTPRLEAAQTIDGDLDALVVGDAVTRRISIRADDTLGLLIPEIRFEAPNELVAYPARPVVEDQANRGRYAGRRVEQVTYMLARPGSFELPAIDIRWWNTGSGSLETQTLDAVQLVVAAGPAAAGAFLDGDRQEETLLRILDFLRKHVTTIGVTLMLAFIAWQAARRYLPPAAAAYRRRRERHEHREARYFRAFARSLSGKDRDRWWASLWAWVDRVDPGSPWSAIADEDFAALWRAEERHRYGRNAATEADGPALARAARASRGRGGTAPQAGRRRLNP